MLFLLSFLLAASPSLQMTSLAAVETQLDGEWKQEQTSLRTCTSPPISEGSLLRVQTKTDGNVHLYAVAVDKKRDYWLLAKREATPEPVRQIWPGGYKITAKDVPMQTLVIVASEKPVPVLESLTTARCPELQKQFPANPPQSICDHLGIISREAPRRVRGCVAPTTALFRDKAATLVGIKSENKGTARVVTEHLFRAQQQ